MHGRRNPDSRTILALAWFAVGLQVLTMILMATEKVSTAVAVALMAIVVVAFLPAMVHIKAGARAHAAE